MNQHVRQPIDGPLGLKTPTKVQNETTQITKKVKLLNPRFYTTNFEKLDRTDVSSVREEWDALLAQMRADPHKGQFKRTDTWDKSDLEALPEDLRIEFVDFLISSLTTEFSGSVLYKEMKRQGKNPDIRELFNYMSRDEARHAGFINDALKDFNVVANLGFLTEAKKYTFFQPKFIFFATYLSKKVNYARYIAVFRHLEKHPDKRFHPIFKCFEKWGNDECAHGEAFSLLMRTEPKLLKGWNKLWIKFFLVSIFTAMFVRDHARPAFYRELGINIEDYDRRVFEITSEISKQCFPLTLDLEHKSFLPILRRLSKNNIKIGKAHSQGGVLGTIKKAIYKGAAGFHLIRLYMIPAHKNTMPTKNSLMPLS